MNFQDLGTQEPQYQRSLDPLKTQRPTPLCLMMPQAWRVDFRRSHSITQTLCEFIAKGFAVWQHALEVACVNVWTIRIHA